MPMPVVASQSVPSKLVGFPWGMPPNFIPEGFAPTFSSMLASSLVLYVPPSVAIFFPVSMIPSITLSRLKVFMFMRRWMR